VQWGLLDGLSEDRRGPVQVLRRRTFARHEVVSHAGDPGDTLHLEGRFVARVATTVNRVVRDAERRSEIEVRRGAIAVLDGAGLARRAKVPA
jgi:hypothetical protein